MDQRPWLSIYPSGLPANIDPQKFKSIVEYLDVVFKKYASKKAFCMEGKEYTYKEIDTLSTQFGGYLQARGLEPGDKFALMMPNILQYPVALIGALKAGLVIVNTNPLYTPREMEHQFTDSGVKGIIIADNFADKLEQILPKTDIKVVITTGIGDMLGLVKGNLVNFTLKNIKRAVPKFEISNAVNFKTALQEGKKFKFKLIETQPEDVIALQYTGGTTGVSKGAMLTNSNLVANMLQIRAIVDPFLEEREDHVVLAPLPLYHIFAFSVNCLGMMGSGALSVLIPNPRNIDSIFKEFKRYQVTGLTGVNTLYNAMINHKGFKDLDFSALSFASAGGAALQRAVAEKWKAITGLDVSEGYGLTETSPVATFNPKNMSRLGSIGIPVPSTDMRIVNDNGDPLPTGTAGEIQIKGPQVMKGYWKKPEETAKVISDDGWFSSGDIGLMEEDGYFKIVDRKKDMILVSGFNVYPNEIEDVVATNPKVLEVAAVGKANEKSGEIVKIFVVKKDNSLTEKELIEYCREHLTGYKVPKEVEFRKELPKSTVGKILRRELKEKG